MSRQSIESLNIQLNIIAERADEQLLVSRVIQAKSELISYRANKLAAKVLGIQEKNTQKLEEIAANLEKVRIS